MLVRCPACGCQMSLDAVVEDGAAAEALRQALALSDLGPLLVRYLALFRPVKSKLTWARVNTLLGELVPLIREERVCRDGQSYAAPAAVWATGLERVLAARDSGALRLPLKTHGYLFEVMAGAAERSVPGVVPVAGGGGPVGASVPLSATAQALARLESRKRRPS